MNAGDWQTIKAVLLESLRLSPPVRASYLDGAGLSAEARAEVESLLALESEAEDFMSLPAGEFTRDILVGHAPEAGVLSGLRVGAYEIISELGSGGMGAVYLARRADGEFEQHVAVKMLRREFNTERLRRNFEREKEILAALTHPNIARLLDAGTTRDGVPYLVMEYVRGEPINQYCRELKLPLNARLKLFNKVCEAVAYAHRNLVVHRDLKPSNILVGEGGEPKLLDFGISKLLDASAADAGHVTQLGALTPQYASPEQVRGEPVTTATDIYSLGVLLFNLLTESLPYRIAGGTNGELLREITDAAPRLPSEVAPPPLTPSRLRGDLDNIVLKALRKEPERRYQTVEQLSADVWRFIDGLPVTARPATLSYRASKFYRRNRTTVWAAALALVSLCAGLAVALSQARAARTQARVASEARAAAELEAGRARAEKERAEKTSRFMQSFLDYANPNWYGRGKDRLDVTVREAIDDAAERIDTELTDAPEVRADLHYTVGEVYRTHGEYERSLRHFRQSLDLYRQVYGEQHPKVARGLYYLSVAIARGGPDTAEESQSLLRQGVVMMRRTDPDNVNLPYMLQALAEWMIYDERARRNENRLAEAERLILEAKELFTRHYGGNHVATLTADSSLAVLALTRGDLARAESIREGLVRRFREADGGEYSHVWALFYLAEVKLALGKRSEAEALFGEASGLARSRWGALDPRFEQLNSRIRKARRAAGR